MCQQNIHRAAGQNKNWGPTPPKSTWKLKEILLLISVQCREVVVVFWFRMRYIFPPSFLSISGASLEENTVLGILQKASAGFPARHERAHVTKDLHICQRFGAEEKGGRPFITLQKKKKKFKLKVGLFFGTQAWSFGSSVDETWQLSIASLFSGQGEDMADDKKGNEEKNIVFYREQSLYVMFGQLYWIGEATLCLDWIRQFVFFLFFWWLFRLCLSNVAANAPKAFSNILLNSACTGKNLI